VTLQAKRTRNSTPDLQLPLLSHVFEIIAKMTESKTPETRCPAPQANTTEATLCQTNSSAAVSPTVSSQDLDSEIANAAHQVQVIEFLGAHQRSIRYASYAIEQALRGKQSNRMSSEDVARRLLHTAREEIESWSRQTKQMVDEVEEAGSTRSS